MPPSRLSYKVGERATIPTSPATLYDGGPVKTRAAGRGRPSACPKYAIRLTALQRPPGPSRRLGRGRQMGLVPHALLVALRRIGHRTTPNAGPNGREFQHRGHRVVQGQIPKTCGRPQACEQRKCRSKDYWWAPSGSNRRPTDKGPLFWLSMFGTRLIWFVRTLADCGRFRLS
jgi:hypothetical protein